MARLQSIKKTGVIAMLAGVSVVVALTVWSGGGLVAAAVASVGFGALGLLLVRMATVTVAGLGWLLLFPVKMRPSAWTCVRLRFIREAANNLLPMAQVGGDFVGARLLTFSGFTGAFATASVIVDVLVQAATQFLFAICGLAILIALGRDDGFVLVAVPGFALAAAALAGFYVAQRERGQRVMRFILDRFAQGSQLLHATVAEVYGDLSAIYASRARLLASGAVHMVGWVIGAGEVYVVFWFMGQPVTWAEALVIESLIDAVRGAAFAVPGALGAQEGGLIVLGALFGIPPEQALALSLVKRAADIVIGVPGLLAWQAAEGFRLRGAADKRALTPAASDPPARQTAARP